MSDALIATDKASVDVSGCFDMATGIPVSYTHLTLPTKA